MTSTMPAIVFDETVDPEHDLHVTLVVAADYNGTPVATLIAAGYPILYVEVGESRYRYLPLGSYATEEFSPFEQAAAAFYYQAGFLPEEKYLRYIESAGTAPDFDGLMEYAEPDARIQLEYKIARALHEWLGDLVPEPEKP